MGYHEYIGDNSHDFHHTDKCEWCGGYVKSGSIHLMHFTPKNRERQIIITPFCCPKCYHESIEKGNTEKDYYENVVTDFIESGGIELWDKEREKQMESYKKTLKKIEEEEIIRERKFKIFKWITTSIIVISFILIIMMFVDPSSIKKLKSLFF
jgi:hypothetical protein